RMPPLLRLFPYPMFLNASVVPPLRRLRLSGPLPATPPAARPDRAAPVARAVTGRGTAAGAWATAQGAAGWAAGASGSPGWAPARAPRASARAGEGRPGARATASVGLASAALCGLEDQGKARTLAS